jgi:hypothetical protein
LMLWGKEHPKAREVRERAYAQKQNAYIRQGSRDVAAVDRAVVLLLTYL